MWARICYWFVLFLLLAGCAPGQAVIEPPAIRYGEDRCAECGMIISDARFASGLLYEVSAGRYQSLVFDDIGNMLVYAEKHPEQKIVAWYVHDYASEEWLDATEAYFVSSREIHTPMGHGIAAHASRRAAQAMADELHGEVLDWPVLQASHDHTSHAHQQPSNVDSSYGK
jgi:copper chaperone NosL